MQQNQLAPQAPQAGEVILDSPERVKKGKKHSERTRRWRFVWNNYPETWYSKICTILAPQGIVHCQQEIAPSTGTPHIQGRIEFKDAKSFKGVCALICKEINWKEEDFKKESIEYCTRLDKRDPNGIMYTNDPKFKEEKKEAPIIREQKVEFKFNNWQQELFTILTTEVVHARKIFWYYDFKGNTGKSTFAKYFFNNYSNVMYCSASKGNDIKYSIMNRHKEGKKNDFIFFDFTRSTENYISYQVIEEVKNGIVFSGKYESETITFETPQVIIFANFYPDTKKLSKDRWIIKRLDKDDVIEDDD